jgi:hypothetical protein
MHACDTSIGGGSRRFGTEAAIARSCERVFLGPSIPHSPLVTGIENEVNLSRLFLVGLAMSLAASAATGPQPADLD